MGLEAVQVSNLLFNLKKAGAVVKDEDQSPVVWSLAKDLAKAQRRKGKEGVGTSKAMTISEFVLRLIPAMLAGIIAVENTRELARQGATKKAILMAAIQQGAQVGEIIPEAHVQAYSATVNQLVGVLYPKAVK